MLFRVSDGLLCCTGRFCFFFFQQKTAYVMRISDWSSDVCSSDLFKLEFGRLYEESGEMRIVVADEISPDSCRLWDVQSNEKLDKDRFRHDLGKVEEAYQEVARRLGILVGQIGRAHV